MINKLVESLSRRSIRIGIGLLISAVSLYLAVRDIELGDILKVLSQASWSMVVLALVSSCLNSLLKALRWKVLLLPAPVRISNTNVLMSTMVGQMFNSIFPARAGELSRVYVMGEMGVGRAFVVGTILLEKVLDMISYTLLIFWMLIWIPHPDWLSQSGWAFAAGTFIVLTGILIFLLRKQEFMAWVDKALLKLPGRIGAFGVGQFQKGLSSFSVLEKRNSLLNLATVTFGIWALAVLTNIFTFRALQIDLPAAGGIIVLIILQAGISLPAAPGKFGIFEYACMLALAIFGISEEVSFSYGLLLHAIVLAPVIISGLFSLWLLGFKEKNWKELRHSYNQMEEKS